MQESEHVAQIKIPSIFHCRHCTAMFVQEAIYCVVRKMKLHEPTGQVSDTLSIIAAHSVKECVNCSKMAKVYKGKNNEIRHIS